MNRFKLEHYHDQGSEMVEDQNGEYVKYEDCQQAIDKELDDSSDLSSRLMEINGALHQAIAEVTQQRDAALAALGEVQAGAAELMAAADALLRERDNYRAACAAAAALCKNGRGS